MLGYFRKYKTFVSKVLLTSFILGFWPGVFAASGFERSEGDSGIFEKISKLYMPSLIELEKDEVQKENKVMASNVIPMRVGNIESLKLAYGILSAQVLKDIFGEFKKNQLLDDCVLTDLEIYSGREGIEGSLFSKIDFTRTPFGKARLQSLFLQRFDELGDSVNGVMDLQRKVKVLIENEALFNKLDEKLGELREILGDVLWMWKPLNDASMGFIDQVYFPKLDVNWGEKNYELDLRRFNQNSFMLSSYFAVGTWGTLVLVSLYYFYRMIRDTDAEAKFAGDNAKTLLTESDGYLGKPNKGIWDSVCGGYKKLVYWKEKGSAFFAEHYIYTAIAAVLLGLHIYTSYVGNKRFKEVFKAIHEKMKRLSVFYGNMASFEESLAGVEVFTDLLSTYNKNKKRLVGEKEYAQFEELFSELVTSTEYKTPSFFMGKGKLLADFKKFLSLKYSLVTSLLLIGEIDMLMSIAKLYKAHAKHPNAKYCFAEFVKSDLPYVDIKGFWHPLIEPDDVVVNDIELGTPSTGRGVILTGPNAAGKSSALKGMSISIILAQTFGIAPASSIKLTPFFRIGSHLNVSDAQGKESLFQAEMNRSLKFLGDVKKLGKGEFMFTILDELFSSTNPEEGMSGAYGIVKSLAGYPQCMSVLATHFKKLTELESQTNGFFRNYKVYVDVFQDGSFKRAFKFVPGISDQSMALLLMQKHGFSKQVVADAFNVLAQVKEDRRSIILPEGFEDVY